MPTRKSEEEGLSDMLTKIYFLGLGLSLSKSGKLLQTNQNYEGAPHLRCFFNERLLFPYSKDGRIYAVHIQSEVLLSKETLFVIFSILID